MQSFSSESAGLLLALVFALLAAVYFWNRARDLNRKLMETAERVGEQATRLALAEAGAAKQADLEKNLAEREIELARLQEAQKQQTRNNDEKLALLQDARERLTKEFKLLSAEQLSQQGQQLIKQNETQMTGLLNPLRNQMGQFQSSLQLAQRENAKERAGLGQQIKELAGLGAEMNQETRNLTRALKGKSQAQGAWGEMVLSHVLERSGLREGQEFSTQTSHSDESGQRFRPDVIVHLPNGERVIVDSKVSLKAYELYVNAESAAERETALTNHVHSLRAHLRSLGGKGYQSLAGQGPEFVILFLPIEEALSAALQANRDLMDEALHNNIVLTTPTTLMVALKTIHNLWTIDRRTQNVEKIAERGGLLYDKFVGFVKDMEELGQRMNQARSSYDSALGKLASGKGNLVKQAEQLRGLGAKAQKQLPATIVEEAAAEELPALDDQRDKTLA
ncbi:MAG: DNA recombination protein RmuC [Rhodospirillales bacterium]|nr:DNA recombination protein RmuC [Rhodospirillales bacterium]